MIFFVIIEIFIISRLTHCDLLESVAEAYLIYAHAFSCMRISNVRFVSIHIAETIYFLVIFLLQSIRNLYLQVTSLPKRHQCIYMIFSMLARLLDVTFVKCIHTVTCLQYAIPGIVESGVALLGLFNAGAVSRETEAI